EGTGEGPSSIWLWQVASGRLFRRFAGGAVGDLAFSPDRRTLAVQRAGRVDLIDVTLGKTRRSIEGDFTAVAFSPSGDTVALGTVDGSIQLEDPAGGRTLRTLEEQRDRIASLRFSPDGSKLAAASWDGTIALWDARAESVIATLEGHEGRVTCLAFPAE